MNIHCLIKKLDFKKNHLRLEDTTSRLRTFRRENELFGFQPVHKGRRPPLSRDDFHFRLKKSIPCIVESGHQFRFAALIRVMADRKKPVSTSDLLLSQTACERQPEDLSSSDRIKVGVSSHWTLITPVVRLTGLALTSSLAASPSGGGTKSTGSGTSSSRLLLASQ